VAAGDLYVAEVNGVEHGRDKRVPKQVRVHPCGLNPPGTGMEAGHRRA
jgi:hypothetical protein